MESITTFHNEAKIETFVLALIAMYAQVDLCIVARDVEEAEQIHREIDTYRKIFAHKEILSKDKIGEILHVFDLPNSDSRDFELLMFPSFETPLYSEVVVEEEVKKERLRSLFTLIESPRKKIVISTLEALSIRTIPKDVFRSFTDIVIAYDEINRDKLIENLIASGYERSDSIERVGEFSIRGGIIDIYSPLYEDPVRIELMGDTVHSLRFFDVDTQKSLENIEEVSIAPASEIIYTNNDHDALYKRIKDYADSNDISKKARDALFEKLETKVYFPGIEYFIPLFYERTSSFFEYFISARRKSLFIYNQTIPLEIAFSQFTSEATLHYETGINMHELLLSPSAVFLTEEELRKIITASNLINLNEKKIGEHREAQSNEWIYKKFHEHLERHDEPIRFLAEHLQNLQEKSCHIVIVSRDRLQEERCKELLRPYFLEGFGNIIFIIGSIARGFSSESLNLLLLADSDIFGERVVKHAKKTRGASFNLSRIVEGDYVVHVDHGIGRYEGLMTLSYNSFKNDFMIIQYAGTDKLYLPVDRLNLVQKYSGGDLTHIELDRFGSSRFKEKRKKAEKAIDEIAGSLLKLYAQRQANGGYAFSGENREEFLEFESSFPYDETADQINAIEDVTNDMELSRPMDRLICGDVGYGKTEVAIRAAYKAVLDGKQVAFLVPTTVLAFQHFNTLIKRFKDHPVIIEELSRFKSKADQKDIIKKITAGTIDIVVGTHRLIQKDVEFKDLGLLVIDEEHKFGVGQKEAIKKLRVNVDTLSLTATPIPRTLQMSLFKLRDFSLIKTPPLDRLSIKTYIAGFRDELIKETISGEIKRNGQVYFVHNRVETIYGMAEYLKKLMPSVRFAIGHGQMSATDLEKVMMSFIRGESDVLICTTIIESGLDIPNANTIIINRADTFGLATLYQLRGRVGRGDRQAYAYLLIPEREMMSADAAERLGALRKFSELGSGFNLAMADLEIRGGGEILGRSQSGHIAAIGYELYMDLLAKQIKRIRNEEVDDGIEPLLKIKMEAFIPPTYIANSRERLGIYKRLSVCIEDHDVDVVRDELIDRFGPIPREVENFLEVIKIKILARKFRIKEIEIHEDLIHCSFDEKTPVNAEKLIGLLKKDSKCKLRFSQKENKLSIPVGNESRLGDFKKVLNELV